MTSTAMDPLGKALADYNAVGYAGVLKIVREDGKEDVYPAADLFATEPASDIERIALAHCYGRVLDVGAGAGRHSLLLQAQGLSVDAIDISPQAVEVMQQRGVKNARHLNVWDMQDGPYDTILLLAHGIGLVGTLNGLARFLHQMTAVIAPAGQILAHSLDVRRTANPLHLAYQAILKARGQYPGEVTLRLRYGDDLGDAFGLLHVDFATLTQIATEAGWQAEQMHETGDGNYLCRLVRIPTQ